jgi:mono/diheme cytochrome c family protein
VALAAGPQLLLKAQRGDAAKGKEVFEQCSVCHNADSTEVKMGPGLKGLYKKAKLTSSGKPVTDANVLAVINAGGKGMPAYKDILSDPEKANLVAYLKTL